MRSNLMINNSWTWRNFYCNFGVCYIQTVMKYFSKGYVKVGVGQFNSTNYKVVWPQYMTSEKAAVFWYVCLLGYMFEIIIYIHYE